MESLRRNRWRRLVDVAVSFMFAAVVALVLWFAAAGAQAQPMTVEMSEARTAFLRSQELAVLEALNGPYIAPHAPHATSRPSSPPYAGSDVVERWRPLVTQYFQASDVEWALRIIACESGGNPNAANPTSSARGLLQHLGRFWPQRSEAAGWAGASIFDPEANIAVGAWLLAKNGKGSWECKA